MAKIIGAAGGFATAVDDAEIAAGFAEVAREEGLPLCPEGAATYAAYKNELNAGRIGEHEQALLFNCATELKYPMPAAGRRLDIAKPIDYASL